MMILRAIVVVRTQRAMEHLHVRHNSDLLSRDIWVHMLIRFMSGRAKNTSHSTKNIIWTFKRLVYGLRTAPREWQDFFADELHEFGCKETESDGHVFVHGELKSHNSCILWLNGFRRNLTHSTSIYQRLHQALFIQQTGHFNEEGSTIRFFCGETLDQEYVCTTTKFDPTFTAEHTVLPQGSACHESVITSQWKAIRSCRTVYNDAEFMGQIIRSTIFQRIHKVHVLGVHGLYR